MQHLSFDIYAAVGDQELAPSARKQARQYNRELVQKHYRSHGEEVAAEKQNEANASAAGRPRTAVACMNCARSKTKCDHKYPCNRCQSKGLQCISRKARRSASSGPQDVLASVDPVASPQVDPSIMEIELSQENNEQHRDISTASPDTSDLRSRELPSSQVEKNASSNRESESSSTSGPGNLEAPSLLDPSLFGPEDIAIDWSKIFSPSQWQSAASLSSGIDLDIFKTPRFQTPHLLNQRSPELSGQTPDFEKQSSAFPMQANLDESVLLTNQDHNSPLSVDIFSGESVDGEGDSNEPRPRDYEFWTLAQCLPFPKSIPIRRDKENISLFAENCRRWSTGSFQINFPMNQSIEVVRLTESTRERVSAIVQGVFHTASEMHGVRTPSNDLDFLPLPPTEALYAFLMNYLHHCDPYYPFVPKRFLNPNHLIRTNSARGATLLLLLMIGFGAMMDPSPCSRQIVCGLMEICRLSHMERTDKHGAVVTEPAITVQCGLMYTIQAAWSGEKWQMDIGVGHRHMYLTVSRAIGFRLAVANLVIKILRNIRFFSAAEVCWQAAETNLNIEQIWAEWSDHETRSRFEVPSLLSDTL